jgi:hypothetical protein
VRVVTFTTASLRERRTGLLGYITLEVGGLLAVDGVALRLTRDGRLRLSFPERTDRSGPRRSLIRPVDAAARDFIEAAVLAALGYPTATAGRKAPGESRT